MRALQNICAKLFSRDPGNYFFWIILALIVKGIFFLFRLHHTSAGSIPGFMGEVWGDTPGYLDPIDNLLKTGVYNSTAAYNQLDRMPGYGAPYFLLRLLFAKAAACNLLIILQVIADAVSVYALALIAKRCFTSDVLFYVTFYTYLASAFTSVYDSALLTESFTTASFIFSVYFLVVYIGQHRLKNLVFSGFFLMWVIFLRQVYFPVLIFVLVFLFFSLLKNNKRAILKALICFTVPFILAEGYWVIRNYSIEKRFIFFIKSHNYYPGYTDYTNYHFALFNFIGSWGGDCVQWYPGAEIKWFWPETITGGKKIVPQQGITLPKDIYTSKFTPDSLELLRSEIAVVEYKDTTQAVKTYYNNLLIKKLNGYVMSEKEEHPYIYYVRAPLAVSYNMLLNSRIFNSSYRRYTKHDYKLYLIDKVFIGFVSIAYLWVIVFGVLGALYCWKDWFRFNTKGLLSVITLYSTFVYPLVFRVNENRYIVPAYPFLLLFAGFLSVILFLKFFSKSGIKGTAL